MTAKLLMQHFQCINKAMDMRVKIILLMLFGLFFCQCNCYSQRFSVSTNLVELASLGNFNVDFSYSFAQHWSVDAKVNYSPFVFKQGTDGQFQLKSRGAYVGAYYWLWHSYSGVYFSFGGKGEEFNEGGIISKRTEEGARFGGAVGVGYALMLAKHVNMEFGVGMWMGYSKYKAYSCPHCGNLLESGEKFFLLPDNIKVAISYIF